MTKNAQLQKQLENVVREGRVSPFDFSCWYWYRYLLLANGEINLLNNKATREQFDPNVQM